MREENLATKNCVALIEDDQEMCKSIQAMMESIGLKTVTFHEGHSFLSYTSLDEFGCLIIDLRLPDISGLTVVEKAAELQSYCPPAIMITGYADVPTAVSAIRGGMIDFLEKPFVPQDLIDQVQNTLQIDAKNRQIHQVGARINLGLSKLTTRERQVLRSLLACKSNKEISSDLDLSSKTIASHRANILAKCQAESLLELAGSIQSCGIEV
ncbi:response regulator transcription factor [Poriferisphaera sp. WC338]|uniref:response regulator transcription factor n=1 Tax=Poriferisphaera sp. WC338 TaxID=3425129 RepID=UPI003D8194CB